MRTGKHCSILALLMVFLFCGTLFAAQDFAATKKAAEGGDAEAQFRLGRMYADGKGVKQDYKQAVEWYRKAAEQGLANAQNHMGVMYKNGRGVTKDNKKAAEWYKKAAEQGHPWAQVNLGHLYEHGFGVSKNRATAIKWYRQAAAQNEDKSAKEQAQKDLKRLGVK